MIFSCICQYSVEAELGKVGGKEEHIVVEDASAAFTDPDDVPPFSDAYFTICARQGFMPGESPPLVITAMFIGFLLSAAQAFRAEPSCGQDGSRN